MKCSFCGRVKSFDIAMVEGHESVICEDCFRVISEDLDFIKNDNLENMEISKLLKPHELKSKLDEYLIGQEDAKRVLSVAVYNHYKRIHSKSRLNIQKTNIMLVGPTGSGKTYIMQVLADILNVPMVTVDATSFTEAGYVGEDVESILKKLYMKANQDVSLAEKGIVYIDEIDKILAKSDSRRDVGGAGVQQALLKIIEDSEITIPMKTNEFDKRDIVMNTKDILFVVGGSFVGIEKIVEGRVNKALKKDKKVMGFATETPELTEEELNVDKSITQDDIIKFGFISEFIGRIPVIVQVNKLSQDELKDILVKPKNAIIKQYKQLFKMDGVNVKFDTDAIKYIVEEADKKNLGARGLKGIIEKQMYNLMFELPKHTHIKQFTITKDLLKENSKEFKFEEPKKSIKDY